LRNFKQKIAKLTAEQCHSIKQSQQQQKSAGFVIAIFETARVNLVDDPVLPPGSCVEGHDNACSCLDVSQYSTIKGDSAAHDQAGSQANKFSS